MPLQVWAVNTYTEQGGLKLGKNMLSLSPTPFPALSLSLSSSETITPWGWKTAGLLSCCMGHMLTKSPSVTQRTSAVTPLWSKSLYSFIPVTCNIGHMFTKSASSQGKISSSSGNLKLHLGPPTTSFKSPGPKSNLLPETYFLRKFNWL